MKNIIPLVLIFTTFLFSCSQEYFIKGTIWIGALEDYNGNFSRNIEAFFFDDKTMKVFYYDNSSDIYVQFRGDYRISDTNRFNGEISHTDTSGDSTIELKGNLDYYTGFGNGEYYFYSNNVFTNKANWKLERVDYEYK